MSALQDLLSRYQKEDLPFLEYAVVQFWWSCKPRSKEDEKAKKAAAELADLRAENERQWEALKIAGELLKFAKDKLDGELNLCDEVDSKEWEWKWKVRYFLDETDIPFHALPDDMRDA